MTQIKLLEMFKMRNTPNAISSRPDTSEEKISTLEDTAIEIVILKMKPR